MRPIATLLLLLFLPWFVLRLLGRGLVERAAGRLSYCTTTGLWQWRWPGSRLSLPLLTLALGSLRLLGPARGTAAAEKYPAGLISPMQLRAKMGLGGRVIPDEDFFANASIGQKLALVLRGWIVRFYGAPAEAAVATEARIFGVQFLNTTMTQAVSFITEAATFRDSGPESRKQLQAAPMRRVFFVNADCLNLAYADRDYHFLLHDADLVLPDGSGVRLGLNWLGAQMADNLNGTDLFPHLCDRARNLGLRLFFLGGQPGIAAKTAQAMQAAYPGLKVAGTRDGYFTPDQEAEVVAAVNASGADILLLGMGAPRQERWLTDNAAVLNVGVGIGVGGLFDYYSGAVSRSPLWLQELGLEWVWRIFQQPADKWRRYTVGNPLFLLRVLRQRIALGGRSWLSLSTLDSSSSSAQSWISMPPPNRLQSVLSRLRVWWWRLSLDSAAIAKRALDVLVASVALVVLAPLLAGLAVLVKLTSPGPVTYQQIRIGRRGVPFTMHKFRSMYCDAEQRLAALQEENESADGVLFKMTKDPRVTPAGRWIRRFSMDELPQLVNVLGGSMSLVGPRPALPAEVSEYESSQLKRLQAKPGLTCWWQVSGRSDLSFKRQIELDIRYMQNQSMGEDLRLLARTVPAVVGGKGAY